MLLFSQTKADMARTPCSSSTRASGWWRKGTEVTLNVAWFECFRNCWSTEIFTHDHLWGLLRTVWKREYPVRHLCGRKCRIASLKAQQRGYRSRTPHWATFRWGQNLHNHNPSCPLFVQAGGVMFIVVSVAAEPSYCRIMHRVTNLTPSQTCAEHVNDSITSEMWWNGHHRCAADKSAAWCQHGPKSLGSVAYVCESKLKCHQKSFKLDQIHWKHNEEAHGLSVGTYVWLCQQKVAFILGPSKFATRFQNLFQCADNGERRHFITGTMEDFKAAAHFICSPLSPRRAGCSCRRRAGRKSSEATYQNREENC